MDACGFTKSNFGRDIYESEQEFLKSRFQSQFKYSLFESDEPKKQDNIQMDTSENKTVIKQEEKAIIVPEKRIKTETSSNKENIKNNNQEIIELD